MRKVLLATTALVGVALFGATSPAQAAPAPSPITVNMGGYVDFVAGFYRESPGTEPGEKRSSRDFLTEFKINVEAMGKAANGIEYGANISLWNGPEVSDFVPAFDNIGSPEQTPWSGGRNNVTVNSAYVWTSGAFGKALFGDEHGASDLFVYAPTVGEGQIDGRYMDFVDPMTLARFQPSGIDNTEHSTKITYYTPKVGNDNHKVQAGVSYAPNHYDYGSSIIKFSETGNGSANSRVYSPYQDVIEGDIAYWGNFNPVSVVLSAQITTGDSSPDGATGSLPVLFQNAPTVIGPDPSNPAFQDFTAWGLGGQVTYAGVTVGGSYNDMGRYGTVHDQNRQQEVWTAGAKYEMDKVSVAANWLNGEGYSNLLRSGSGTTASTVNGTNYVMFNAYGAGATYTWFPGLTSAVDGVFFNQSANRNDHNEGYVIMLSQKMTF
ncbi:MAG: porin [Alphaproteobacteria bacterium]|nr:porin [Alphaproteobacteria bacterium]